MRRGVAALVAPVVMLVLPTLVLPTPVLPTPARTAAVVAEPVVTGVDFPAAFTFAPDGRIFYGERFTGEIRIFDPSTSADTLFFTLPDVLTAGEQGLLGLALSRKFPDHPYVYAYYTRSVGGAAQNQIVRLTYTAGVGRSLRTLVRLPAANAHNGGVIHFGPGGALYAVVGDVTNRSHAQNLSSLAGKVLRMTPLGEPATGNPFPNSRVWSYGHRNMFGFAFDPTNGWLWVTANGSACNDEINRIKKGGNFGWGPNETCTTPPPPPLNSNQDGPNPILPEAFYGPPMIAPTGAAFCQACGLGAATEGTLLFGAWRGGEIRRLTLTANRAHVASQTVLYDHLNGVVAVERAPNGTVHFSDPIGIYRLALSG